MKTQLIQLDPSDDVISVRDKMGWSQTSRIMLVWPDSGQILTQRLDLILLQRHSAWLGAQLALVTKSPVIREIAQELNLSVFSSSRQAQNARWRGRRRPPFYPKRLNPPMDVPNLRDQHLKHKPDWQTHPITRYGLFVISILAIVLLFLYFFPSANITLQPETQLQIITLPVTTSLQYDAVNLAGEIPAQLQKVVVEGRASLPTTGNMLIPGESAKGTVSFTNLTSQPISVPKGQIVTTLDTEPIRFYTTKAGLVPAGPGRIINLPVQALVPGEHSNLSSGNLVAVEGEIGLSLSVNNTYATRGGTDVPAPAPTQEDRHKLLDQLTTTLMESASTDLQNSLNAGDLLILTSLELANILEETYIPANGLPGDQLELILRLEYQAMTIQLEDLHKLVIPVLDGSLPEGMDPLPATLKLIHSRFSSPNRAGEVTWKLTAQRSLVVQIPTSEVIQLSLGQPVGVADGRLLSRLPLATNPEVEVNPSWWPRLPYLPFRIQVIIE